ncbi:hypothetical protein [Paenibacillus sp. GbtcB18]|uniref:hypothetical protein n=1 Tax=Paenibacillus sp. GbtcB18 TaxID=2824763 RepID=UPI001C30380D|nr:hypothetical protein [Paenibacillus sp. GbtcB18]
MDFSTCGKTSHSPYGQTALQLEPGFNSMHNGKPLLSAEERKMLESKHIQVIETPVVAFIVLFLFDLVFFVEIVMIQSRI